MLRPFPPAKNLALDISARMRPTNPMRKRRNQAKMTVRSSRRRPKRSKKKPTKKKPRRKMINKMMRKRVRTNRSRMRRCQRRKHPLIMFRRNPRSWK